MSTDESLKAVLHFGARNNSRPFHFPKYTADLKRSHHSISIGYICCIITWNKKKHPQNLFKSTAHSAESITWSWNVTIILDSESCLHRKKVNYGLLFFKSNLLKGALPSLVQDNFLMSQSLQIPYPPACKIYLWWVCFGPAWRRKVGGLVNPGRPPSSQPSPPLPLYRCLSCSTLPLPWRASSGTLLPGLLALLYLYIDMSWI